MESERDRCVPRIGSDVSLSFLLYLYIFFWKIRKKRSHHMGKIDSSKKFIFIVVIIKKQKPIKESGDFFIDLI